MGEFDLKHIEANVARLRDLGKTDEEIARYIDSERRLAAERMRLAKAEREDMAKRNHPLVVAGKRPRGTSNADRFLASVSDLIADETRDAAMRQAADRHQRELDHAAALQLANVWHEDWAEQCKMPEHKQRIAWARFQDPARSFTACTRCSPHRTRACPHEHEEAVREVHEWLTDPEELYGTRGLFLFGPIGCGKTFGQAYAVRYWSEPGKRRGRVSWLSANDLIDMMLHDYDETRIKGLARNVILDDIGGETKPGMAAALKKLVELPGYRRILASSNLPQQDTPELPSFVSTYPSPALQSRLNDDFCALYLKGESLRSTSGGF